jgi:cell division protein FtsW
MKRGAMPFARRWGRSDGDHDHKAISANCAQPRPAARARGAANASGAATARRCGLWFWEIDRVLLLLVTLLIGIGLIAVAAAAPAAAGRYSDATHVMPARYYFWRQLIWTALAVPVLIGDVDAPQDLRAAARAGGAAIFTLMLVLVPIMGGAQKNGAQRWIFLGPIQVQPSEFLKPLFVVAVAWLLSLKAKDEKLPVVPLSFGLLALIAAFLMKQPDFGQTVIFVSVWLVLLMLSGVPMKWLGALGGAGVGAIGLAYLFYPVARCASTPSSRSAMPPSRSTIIRWSRRIRTITMAG